MSNLVCRTCSRTYSMDDPRWKCDCGGLLDIDFTPVFDLERIRSRPPTLWRYREALPIAEEVTLVSFDEGFTPLIPFDFGGRPVMMKQDHLFQSGSYKDRGATVMISKIEELGIHHVVEDSSGNAGCAVAAYCARAGIACDIYVPADTSPAKLAQIQLYGSKLVRVPGSREDTAAAVWSAAEHTYYASHVWNPFFFQGTKTWAYEVTEQLGWNAPDTVILPAGNGTLLLGAYLGFQDLVTAGIIRQPPKIVAVQAAACAPLSWAYSEGSTEIPTIQKRDTLAEGIAIALPARGKQILDAVRSTGGIFLTVTESEIEQSLREMTRQGGYIEPTSAAVTAAVTKYVETADKSEQVVSVFTGNGLKSTEKMLKIIQHGIRD